MKGFFSKFGFQTSRKKAVNLNEKSSLIMDALLAAALRAVLSV